jgi:Diacylglycerol kinase catalytic domain
MVERVLLLVNRSAGTGHRSDLAVQMGNQLRKAAGPVAELDVEVVDDHPAARSLARDFLAASPRPCALIVAGGGGTLRAVVEGVCENAGEVLPGANQIRIGVLRMGSGNVVARHLGVAGDPGEGIAGIAASLLAGRTTACSVIRCHVGTSNGGRQVRHAVTMCGLGQFGRTPGDLARWHRRYAGPRRGLASLAGIERLNQVEYLASAGGRMLASMVYAPNCELVEVTFRERRERFRLLAGAVMNLRVGGMPFDAGVGLEEAAVGVRLLPWGGKVRAWRLGHGERLELTVLDRPSIEFFLDEDPEVAHGGLSIEVAGTLAFVPGCASAVAA